ncbi:MAG: hypothetical protein HOG89_01345 [Candidatus Peribacter sp.]|jgi:hypothetical protein|nr:hypothetical protein [Candidatus Peribacter sp.]MBT4393294.1 hypothetical protein [Candidatus Peribacter sp.]MBT4601189.1 hypothetical protein [Candidatus Peribacter sp.]MBT5148851.1 hypothetical protein [Candidatus Peribacter sp.]MBT5637269.1 hypothetical protein [Candidatus Peribacter sp.]
MSLRTSKVGEQLIISSNTLEQGLAKLPNNNSKDITPKQPVDIVVNNDPELTGTLTGITTIRVTRRSAALILSICKRGDEQIYPAPRPSGQGVTEDDVAGWLSEGNEKAHYTPPPVDVSGETVLGDDVLEPEAPVADLVEHTGSTGETESTSAAAKIIEELKKQEPQTLPKQPKKSGDASSSADSAIKRRFNS